MRLASTVFGTASLLLAILTAISRTAVAAEPEQAPYPSDVPHYQEEALAAGIDHRYEGGWEFFVGGGVASFDCNGDRMPELFLAGGTAESALYINKSNPGGALLFERQTSTTTDLTQVTGAYPLDIDNDGHLDLAVLRVGENRLLKGGPDCQFELANARFEFDGGFEWSTAFAATFEASARFPTLAFGHYVDRTAPGSPWGTCHDNTLYRAETDDDETESDTPRYTNPAPLSPGHCALSMLFTDWNKSGTDSLRITNDRHYHRDGQEQLWRLDSGRYPRQFTTSEGWERLVIWGMGIAEGDLDADGFPEYALTSMGDTKLQRIDRDQAIEENRPAYDDIAWNLGATAHRPYTGGDIKPSTGWHADFEDVNNDALLDLFIAKGNVEAMTDFASVDPNNLLLGTHDGRFQELGEQAGIALERRGRGAAVVDLNADGLLDLAVVNRDAPLSLFRQLGARSPQGPRPTGNWLKIALTQERGNRNAIGARLAIQTGNHVQMRRIQVGGGHASGSAGFVHIGLGVAERASVRVQWPDGEWSSPYRLFANHHALIERGQTGFRYWFPANPPSTNSQ